jgi:hypothetical protein
VKQELQDQLFKKFPNLFINDRFDGFWIDDSWYDLIYNLSDSINNIISLMPQDKQLDYFVVQIKNKFGLLRYYLNKSTPEINELISLAENESYFICYGCSGKIEEESKKDSWNVNHCNKCSIIKKLLE